MPATADELMAEGIQCALLVGRMVGPPRHVMLLRAQCYIAAAKNEIMAVPTNDELRKEENK